MYLRFPDVSGKRNLSYDYKEVIPLQAYESDMKENPYYRGFARLEYDYQKRISFQQVSSDGSSTRGEK